ncbi:hypothetical protein JOL62DRAFT_577015, partial [Phyllosticta paracitricarpa]
SSSVWYSLPFLHAAQIYFPLSLSLSLSPPSPSLHDFLTFPPFYTSHVTSFMFFQFNQSFYSPMTRRHVRELIPLPGVSVSVSICLYVSVYGGYPLLKSTSTLNTLTSQSPTWFDRHGNGI